jgi:hypothetical protein
VRARALGGLGCSGRRVEESLSIGIGRDLWLIEMETSGFD